MHKVVIILPYYPYNVHEINSNISFFFKSCIFLMRVDVEHPFMYLFTICNSSFDEVSVQSIILIN